MAKKRRRGWGAGSVEQLRSGYWRIRWRERDGQRRTAKYADRGDAEAILARILANVRAGKPSGYVDPESATVPSLSELAGTWLARRQQTHRAWRDDQNRWRKHLEPVFGHLRGLEVNQATIRRFVEAKLAEGLSSTTVGHCVRLLSTFMADVVEQGFATSNPVAALPRATRRLYRNARPANMKRFLEKREDIARLYGKMAQPGATIFAVSALAGLRPGEVIALEWGDIDLDARRILVQRQARHGRVGVPKSGHGRIVPIGDALAKVLAEWKLATGGKGQLFNPARAGAGGHPGAPPRFVSLTRIHEQLRAGLKACGLSEGLTLYDCGRATFASQWVLGGGSMEKLAKILGHASVTTTEASYSRMRPEMVRPSELSALDVDLTRTEGEVIDIRTARRNGHEMTTATDDAASSNTATPCKF